MYVCMSSCCCYATHRKIETIMLVLIFLDKGLILALSVRYMNVET